MLISMNIWLGNKTKNGQIHSERLENFTWPKTLFLALKFSSVHKLAARDLSEPVRALIVLHVVCKSLRYRDNNDNIKSLEREFVLYPATRNIFTRHIYKVTQNPCICFFHQPPYVFLVMADFL